MNPLETYRELLGRLFTSMLPGQQLLPAPEALALVRRLAEIERALPLADVEMVAAEEARRFQAATGRCAWCGERPHDQSVEVEW